MLLGSKPVVVVVVEAAAVDLNVFEVSSVFGLLNGVLMQ